MTVVGPALSLYPSAVTSIRYNTAVIKYSYHYMIFYVCPARTISHCMRASSHYLVSHKTLLFSTTNTPLCSIIYKKELLMKSLMDGFAAYKSTTYSSQDVYVNTRSVDILNKQVFELVINRIPWQEPDSSS